MEARDRGDDVGAGRDRLRGRRLWSTPMALAAAASRCTRGWERTMCSRSALPPPIHTTSSRSIAVRSSTRICDGALEAAWAIAEPLISVGKPLDIQITATESGLDVDVRGSGPVAPAMIARLSQRRQQHRLARLTRHGELVLMRTPPVISIGAAQVALPPGSFLQATVAGEETLASLVADHCKRAKHIADLFCGVGPFALAAGNEIAGGGLRQRRRRHRGACRRQRRRHLD